MEKSVITGKYFSRCIFMHVLFVPQFGNESKIVEIIFKKVCRYYLQYDKMFLFQHMF